MEIRKIRIEDLNDIRYICLKTADNYAAKDEKAMMLLYADYYVENERDTSFVAVDNGKVVGYLLASFSFKKYKREWNYHYLNKLKNLSEDLYKLKKIYLLYDSFVSVKYPAHLHVDILPEYQSKGYGTLLLKKILQLMKEKKIKGVRFGCDKSKTKALSFYQKMGFKILTKTKTGFVFGMTLKEIEKINLN